MKRYMKAGILVRPNEMKVEEVPIPEPEPGWVRLKNKASGICGSDMHIYTGNHPWLKPGNPMAKYVLGNIYGHEVAGIVDKPGENVTGVKVGDRVAVVSIVPCMECEFCRVGLYQICKNLKHYGFHYPGGFAEYMTVPHENVCPLPDNVSFEEGALLDVLVVGLHAVQIAKVSIADRIAILGAGPIGLAIAAMVKRAGAREIFITAKYQIQKDIAKIIGINNIMDSSDSKLVKKIIDKTDSFGVDCVLESIGYKAKTIELGLAIIRKGGRIIFTGVFEEPVCLNFGDLLIKEATVTASHAFGMWNLVPEFGLANELLAQGVFPAKEIITHRFPLEKINDAFQQKINSRDTTMKVQLTF